VLRTLLVHQEHWQSLGLLNFLQLASTPSAGPGEWEEEEPDGWAEDEDEDEYGQLSCKCSLFHTTMHTVLWHLLCVFMRHALSCGGLLCRKHRSPKAPCVAKGAMHTQNKALRLCCAVRSCAVLSGDDGSDEQELPEEEYDAAMGESGEQPSANTQLAVSGLLQYEQHHGITTFCFRSGQYVAAWNGWEAGIGEQTCKTACCVRCGQFDVALGGFVPASILRCFGLAQSTAADYTRLLGHQECEQGLCSLLLPWEHKLCNALRMAHL
jgi:hypothetical protein